jgi:flavin reductase (DIM6/NTAB) family NADH-FMN oxidoreductase RutF
MRTFRKKDFPVSEIHRLLEPGPIVLVSSAWKGRTNIQTMGWHMVMGFSPSLIDQAVGIGNCSGREVDKFARFNLAPLPDEQVSAPLIQECYANFECKLLEGKLVSKWGLFIWEVVKAHAATAPKYPKTFHYRGDGVFMISSPSISLRKEFKSEML